MDRSQYRDKTILSHSMMSSHLIVCYFNKTMVNKYNKKCTVCVYVGCNGRGFTRSSVHD